MGDQLEIKKKFQDKENWKGKHEDRGAIPDDNIDWGDQVWIRLKHKKIKDLQKKINEGDKSGEDELTNLKNLLDQEREAKKAAEQAKDAAERAKEDAEEASKKAEQKKQQAEKERAEALTKQASTDELANQIEDMEKDNEQNSDELKNLKSQIPELQDKIRSS